MHGQTHKKSIIRRVTRIVQAQGHKAGLRRSWHKIKGIQSQVQALIPQAHQAFALIQPTKLGLQKQTARPFAKKAGAEHQTIPHSWSDR